MVISEMKKIFVLALLVIAAACEKPEKENFRIQLLKGRDLNGSVVDFTSVKESRFVINFYSPVCVPCIEELPALQMLSDELSRKNIPVYIAVEGNPEVHEVFPEQNDPESVYQAIRKRIQEDAVRYNIKIPVVILDPAFKISPESGLITGTPETLIMDGSPMHIRYNFIGPVSRFHNASEVYADTRFQFAVKKATE
jgi:thiol-disulfide isomerase/thioredoxin